VPLRVELLLLMEESTREDTLRPSLHAKISYAL
jgi:hypothetical protein